MMFKIKMLLKKISVFIVVLLVGLFGGFVGVFSIVVGMLLILKFYVLSKEVYIKIK